MIDDEKRPLPESNEEHRSRMRHDWQDLMEDLIIAGQEQGLFDNLPGAGKPLNLNKNPYARDVELAHALLKDNDLPPSWIADRQDVLAKVAKLRSDMARDWEWHIHAYQPTLNATQRSGLSISWDDACRRWQTTIDKLNKRIDRFNLKRPVEHLELFRLTLDDELKRLGARRYL